MSPCDRAHFLKIGVKNETASRHLTSVSSPATLCPVMPISRTHRPRFFADVTGQKHITETLRKEIISGVIGHALLFSGPRGVGKTTTARIFAKALLNPTTDQGEPPAESDVSKEIDQGSCIDLIELDAASHTGVENVREAIIDHVRFAPARWGKKVYIIDECHMLSTSAWNALLKTLEEPPSYAYFILATTELHKVPETIVSRCQRFEFHRIAPVELADRVRTLAAAEGIRIDEAVVNTIVHASDGCVRDAESLLDQLASLGTEQITQEIASLVLPTSRIPIAVKIVESCLKRDVGNSLAVVREVLEGGIQPMDIINDLLVVSRSLIRCEDSAERDRLSQGDEGDQAIVRLRGSMTLAELGSLSLLLIERRRDAKTGTDPQFVLELVILALAGELLQPSSTNGTNSSVMTESPQAKPMARTAVRSADAPPPISATSIPMDSKKEQAKTNEYQIEQKHERVSERIQTETTKEVAVPVVSSTPVTPVTPNAGTVEPKIDVNDLRILWNTIIREVEKENRSIPFILKVAKPMSTDGRKITLAFSYDFHREKILDDLKIKGIVERSIAQVLKVDYVIVDGVVISGKSDSSVSSSVSDIVSKVLDTFGGEIVSTAEPAE